jgi:inosose dehydratase
MDPAPAFGVDLITFFDPTYWRQPDPAAFRAYGAAQPGALWSRMLDALARSGIQQLELTFAPADYRTAQAAFGSVPDFGAELARRGLGVTSGYFGGIEHAADISSVTVREQVLAEADGYAGVLAELGGRHLVVGLPMRRNATGGAGYQPVDLRTAEPVAELVNQLGQITARHGIRTLLHTESHSMLWNSRDVDLMMLLTDALTVGLCLDTGHVTLAGADPVAIAGRHLDRIGLLHWKDAAGPFPGMPPVNAEIHARHRQYFRPIGEGIVDWPALAALLTKGGYQDCVLLELDAAPDPEAALTAARGHLETTLGDALPRYAPPPAHPLTSNTQE